MAWIDGSSVKLGCIGFSKTKSFRNSRFGSPLANDVCKEANSKAHLIEIFDDNQSSHTRIRRNVTASTTSMAELSFPTLIFDGQYNSLVQMV